jgi:hypothetical protein
MGRLWVMIWFFFSLMSSWLRNAKNNSILAHIGSN